MAHYREQAEWSAEQALSYITGLEAVDEESEYEAFATAYNYFMNLSKKKISWSVHLEKLAYEFIELAFDNNKHSSIKDVLKAYRSLTQGQYTESLKDVLEHYRDRKLQTILQDDLLEDNVQLIRNLPNIENQQASSTMIFSSFKPQEKKKLQQLRNKLKIVWEGYKYIVETVRINQKLQDVFKATLSKIFYFVDKYNRKHEFKSFCKTLHSTLQTQWMKTKTQQQKAIYIDLGKNDVNDRNIQIRLDQFKVTIKLGLWQEAFQVMEDINYLMKIRKGPVKSSYKFRYYQNLALLFKKSNYWHYHAFAYYNYFMTAQKNPKLTQNQRQALVDKLLLSILSIPPITHESYQSKDSQQKISSMMISSTKIPSKEQLFKIVVSSGISENASNEIKNLWNFMFLQFDLNSLNEGLKLLSVINEEKYGEFKNLIEDILIYKQLQSISEIYQKIKVDSLLSLIPLPRQKIEKILLSSYHQKILDFILDEEQKIILFKEKSLQSQKANITEHFLSTYIDLAIQNEKHQKLDQKHILKKLENFITTSQDYYWKIRQFKIDEYRKKLKKPKQELLNETHRRKMMEKEARQRAEAEKLAKQQEEQRLAEEKKKEFGAKKIIINDIKDIKQNRIVRIAGKKVEDLTDDEIQNISLETLSQQLEDIKLKIQNNKQARYKKTFNNVDYLERQRRQLLDEPIKKLIPSKQQEQKIFENVRKGAQTNFQERKALQEKVNKMMGYLKPKIQDQTKKMENKYENQMLEYKQRLSDYYKEKIIARAKQLAEDNAKKNEEQARKMRQAESQYFTGKWVFKQVSRVEVPAETGTGGIKIGKNVVDSKPTESTTTTNVKPAINMFQKLEGMKDQKEEKPKAVWGRKKVEEEQKPAQKQQKEETKKWGRKQTPAAEPQTQTNSFVPPPPTEKKTFGLGMGKKPEPKKDDGKPKPKKSYVNVN